MYGAILGDIIGSPYEFDRGSKTKDFPLFSRCSEFTDDTAMTIAVADAFLPVQPDMDDDAIRKRVVAKMQKYGWEFLFLGANIDAAKEAARFGIDADRAADYHADSVGTEVIYEAVCETVRDFRASRPMAAAWKKRIDEDFKKRGR